MAEPQTDYQKMADARIVDMREVVFIDVDVNDGNLEPAIIVRNDAGLCFVILPTGSDDHNVLELEVSGFMEEHQLGPPVPLKLVRTTG